jgi:hypothetical protein
VCKLLRNRDASKSESPSMETLPAVSAGVRQFHGLREILFIPTPSPPFFSLFLSSFFAIYSRVIDNLPQLPTIAQSDI